MRLDAPLLTPPPSRLATEAREHRLLPGDGELPLSDVLAAPPDGVPLAAEVPNQSLFAGLSPADRARRAYRSTSALLR